MFGGITMLFTKIEKLKNQIHVSSVKQKMSKITTIFARFYNELA